MLIAAECPISREALLVVVGCFGFFCLFFGFFLQFVELFFLMRAKTPLQLEDVGCAECG